MMPESTNTMILWETSKGGSPAILQNFKQNISHPGTALKNIAVAKMTDVSVISASFGEKDVVFDPWVSVMFDSGQGLAFYGAYSLSFPIEHEDQSCLPHICLRTCSWNRNLDFLQFEKAANKQDYLLSSKQISSNIVYTSASTALLLKEQVSQLCYIVQNGVKGKTVERHNPPWINVSIDSTTDFFSWKFSYSPCNCAMEGLEEWTKSLRTIIEEVKTCFSPSGSTRISYKPSLMERLDLQDELKRGR